MSCADSSGGIAPNPALHLDSQVETFAAIRLRVENWRWAGVPIFIRAGKCLPTTTTEIYVKMKHSPQVVFAEDNELAAHHASRGNNVRFRLSPDVFISIGALAKVPGDALRGDQRLFAREVAIEATWGAVDPIVGEATPPHDYEPNT
jgi:glucose-6-phosphate 1-dehydrogenase